MLDLVFRNLYQEPIEGDVGWGGVGRVKGQSWFAKSGNSYEHRLILRIVAANDFGNNF
ncbi:hypothetical protein M0802_016298 [Mischocyttarus mexicanus]|nr:hypothetical protein M0802_016298 [Mischocyttarus mexicanus]